MARSGAEEIGCSEPSLSSHHEFGYSSFSWSARARALVSTPALAAARSSYRPAAKAHERIAELLPLPSCTDPPCSHRFRVALDGTSSPYTAMSSSSQGAVLDPMDTTSHPSPRTQGNEPPPPPSPRDEAGAADGGNRPGPRHGDHQSGSSSSSTSAKTASIQGEEDPGAAAR